MLSRFTLGFVLLSLACLAIRAEDASVEDGEEPEVQVEDDSPVVSIVEGKLRGKLMTSYGGQTINAFLGIPYAKPPLGELRFTHPRRPEHWTGVKSATTDAPKCAQLLFPERTYAGDENCLFLNVYTKLLPEVTGDMDIYALHDVIVLIHDGGFSYGSGDSDAYLPDNLLEHDIVLVTFNYRLGVLGFLSTGDEWAVGNYGLKDQFEVLSWIHRNIINFGGNPKSVTLMGSHAGGSSAHLHLLSPLSKDRFDGAISISGTALSPWAIIDTAVAKRRAEKLGKLCNCTKKELATTKSLVKCLRNKFTLDLIENAPKVLEWPTDYSHPFGPVVEAFVPKMRPFLPLHPIEMMKTLPSGPQGKWEKPWLVGFASHEALPMGLQAMVFPYIMNSLNANPDKYAPLFLGIEHDHEPTRRAAGRKLWDYYLQNQTLSYNNIEKLAEMASDYNVYRGVWKSVGLHTKSVKAPIYSYRFSFDRRSNLKSLGVPQGDDMEYMFPNIIANVKRTYKEKERPAIEKLTKLIATFARHGDPTPEGSDYLGDVGLWPQVTQESFEFVDIGKEFTIEEGFYPERMKLWDEIEAMLEAPIVHDEL